MANPQWETDGFTKIARPIMEALIKTRIPGEARQCLDFIIYKTYGFNKKEDYIALSQFCLATGLKKPHVCKALRKLIAINIITQKDNGKGNSYRFNKDFDTWKPLPKKVTTKNPLPKKVICVTQKGNASLPKKVPTKENTTKETITKENKNTIVRDFIGKYCESFKALYGINPHISGKDAGIAKRLVQIPDIEVIMGRFFQSKDKFIVQNRHSLSILESQINKLMVGEIDKYSGIKEWLEEKEKKEIAKE